VAINDVRSRVKLLENFNNNNNNNNNTFVERHSFRGAGGTAISSIEQNK